MKKLFLLASAILIIAAVSCKKDKNTAATSSSTTTQNATPLTPAEGKNTLQSSGISMVNETKAFKNAEGVQVSKQMIDLMNSSGDLAKSKGQNKASNFFMPQIEALVLYSQNKLSEAEFFKIIGKSTSKSNTETETEYLKVCGTYSWNPSLKDWDEAGIGTGTQVIYKFPSTSTSTTNDASLTVSKYDANIITDADAGEIEYPVALTWNLKKGAKTVIDYAYSAKITSNRPTEITSKLTITPFIVLISMTNNNTRADVTYSFTNGTKIIMKYTASANGNWTESNVNSNVYTHPVTSNTYDYSTYPPTIIGTTTHDEFDSVAFNKIVQQFNTSFRIFDVKLSGGVTVDKLYTAAMELDKKTYDNDSLQMVDIAKLVNNNITLTITKVSTGALIATAEAYTISNLQTHQEYVGMDQYTYQPIYQDVSTKSFDIDMRMIFKDGSKADLDTYFSEGFASLETDINTFLNDLNSEWDLGLDPNPVSFKDTAK